jgi:5-methylcytosine-specific restriction endonuclease McrA
MAAFTAGSRRMVMLASRVIESSYNVLHSTAVCLTVCVDVNECEADVPDVILRAEAKAAGLKRYWNGKACKNGHISERLVSNGGCLVCGHSKVLKWRAKNHAAHLAIKRASYHKCKANHVAQRAGKYLETRNSVRIAQRAYYLDNSEKIRSKVKEYRLLNPELVTATKRNTKAKRSGAEGFHTLEDIKRIGGAQKWKCAWCRRPCKKEHEIDHIIPIAKGGTNWPNNLCVSCRPCNRAKAARDPIEFSQSMGMLL